MKRSRSTNLENLEQQRLQLENKVYVLQRQIQGIDKSIDRLKRAENKKPDSVTETSVAEFPSR